jgi:hypothetical protein
MLQIGVTSIGAQGREARQAVRERLAREGIEPDHVLVVEAVAHELLAAAFDSSVTEPVILTVEPSSAVTEICVRSRSAIDLRDEPFGLRERILDTIALAYGLRPHADGTVELWAEVAR